MTSIHKYMISGVLSRRYFMYVPQTDKCLPYATTTLGLGKAQNVLEDLQTASLLRSQETFTHFCSPEKTAESVVAGGPCWIERGHYRFSLHPVLVNAARRERNDKKRSVNEANNLYFCTR